MKYPIKSLQQEMEKEFDKEFPYHLGDLFGYKHDNDKNDDIKSFISKALQEQKKKIIEKIRAEELSHDKGEIRTMRGKYLTVWYNGALLKAIKIIKSL